MTIEAHSRIARYYKGRPPYTSKFFQAAVKRLGVTDQSVLLDLCCGRGELAAGFADACKAVYAVDGSQAMLDHGIAKPNVHYLLHDVNKDEITLPEKVDHITIGSAIHWVEPESLARLAERSLKPGGMVLLAFPQLVMADQPWHPALAKLNASYGRGGTSNKKELEGEGRMNACGFSKVDGIAMSGLVRFDANYLYMHQMSYAYGDRYRAISSDPGAYRQRLADAVAPYLDANGELSAKLSNRAVLYARVVR